MWTRAEVAALGVWLMAAPAVLGYAGAAATSDRIAGPVVATVALIAMSPVMRGLRNVNTVVGAWIAVAPLVLDHDGVGIVNAVLTGVLIVALSRVGGAYGDRFAGGWSSLWK